MHLNLMILCYCNKTASRRIKIFGFIGGKQEVEWEETPVRPTESFEWNDFEFFRLVKGCERGGAVGNQQKYHASDACDADDENFSYK